MERRLIMKHFSRRRYPLHIEGSKPISRPSPLTIYYKTKPITFPTSPPSMMEGTSMSSPTTLANKYLLTRVKLRIQYLRKEYQHALRLEESLSQGKSLDKEEQEVIRNMPAISYCIGELKKLFALLVNVDTSVSTTCHAVLVCPFQERANMKDNTSEEIIDPVDPWNKDRYLCVSDGFTVCCFDIKKEASEISSVRLPDEGFPLLLGLFKSAFGTFMVPGGRALPSCKDPDLKVFSKTYHLCVADGSLNISQCDNIGPLNKSECVNIEQPQFWPTVVRFDDYVHLIETLRSSVRLEIVSHKALQLNDPTRGWVEISPGSFPKFTAPSVDISRHIVVGHRMYARDGSQHGFVVFDSKTKEWECHSYGRICGMSLYPIKHVAQILQIGFGSCLGEYAHGESRDPLYVVLAVGSLLKGKLIAAAYLVTSMGQVVCFQRLNRFFEGSSLPYHAFNGRVIRGDEQHGKSVCTIFRGSDAKSLIIGSCTWEESDEALALVSCLQEQQTRDVDTADKLPFAEEEDFISVVVNGWHTCQLKNGWERYHLSACFV